MRKITSKRTEEKKQKRNQRIGSIVIIAILFFSILGYSVMNENSEKNKIIYKEYEFIEENGFWFVEKEGFVFSFRYKPNEIEEIAAAGELNLLEDYYSKPLYILSEDIESESEIYRNLASQNGIVLRMQLACLEGEVCSNSELPVKTCGDNFIIIKKAEETEIRQEENCVFIEGKSEELAKITDGFLMRIIGL